MNLLLQGGNGLAGVEQAESGGAASGAAQISEPNPLVKGAGFLFKAIGFACAKAALFGLFGVEIKQQG